MNIFYSICLYRLYRDDPGGHHGEPEQRLHQAAGGEGLFSIQYAQTRG